MIAMYRWQNYIYIYIYIYIYMSLHDSCESRHTALLYDCLYLNAMHILYVHADINSVWMYTSMYSMSISLDPFLVMPNDVISYPFMHCCILVFYSIFTGVCIHDFYYIPSLYSTCECLSLLLKLLLSFLLWVERKSVGVDM